MGQKLIIRETIGTDRNYPTSGVIPVSDFLIYGALSKTNKYKHLKPFLDSSCNNVSNGIGGMQIQNTRGRNWRRRYTRGNFEL